MMEVRPLGSAAPWIRVLAILAATLSSRPAQSDEPPQALSYPDLVVRCDANLQQCRDAATPEERQACVEEARALIRSLDVLGTQTREAAILEAELFARIGAAYDQTSRQAQERDDRKRSRDTAITAYQSYVDIILGQGRLAPLTDIEYARLDRVKARIAQLAQGQLELEVTPPGARVFIDGDRQAAIGGRLALELPDGSHSVRVEAPGHATAQRVIDIEADRVTREAVSLRTAGESETPARWQTTAGWIATGVAAVALGVGIGCLVAAADKESQIDDARAPDGVIDTSKLSPSDAQALRSEADTLDTAGAVSLTAAGLAAGAAVLFFFWPDEPAEAVSLPSWSPVRGGFVASWQGRF